MLILLTPSTTVHKLNEIWTGNTETSLAPAGIVDARSLEYHDGVDVERAYCAPAAHLQEFANIVLVRRKYSVLTELTDRSMGTLTGRNYRETMAEFPRRKWLAWHRSYWTAPPDGESFFNISDRVLTAFRTKILPVPSVENVAIIAAPDVLRILIGYLTKTEETEVPKINVEPCIPHVINGDLA